MSDIEAVHARAKAAGAKMLLGLEDRGYGGKAFTCADPEGHVWHVGTFDPWAPQKARGLSPDAATGPYAGPAPSASEMAAASCLAENGFVSVPAAPLLRA